MNVHVWRPNLGDLVTVPARVLRGEETRNHEARRDPVNRLAVRPLSAAARCVAVQVAKMVEMRIVSAWRCVSSEVEGVIDRGPVPPGAAVLLQTETEDGTPVSYVWMKPGWKRAR